MSFRKDNNNFYGGHRSYHPRERPRPRSHSPTPQLHQRSNSPPNYNRWRPPYRQYGNRPPETFGYNNRPSYRGSYARYGWQPWNRRKYPWQANDSTRRSNESPRRSYSPNPSTSGSKRLKTESDRKSPQQDLAESTGTGYASCIEDAKKIFYSDCQTVAEVTQLLINEDRELEERIVSAMKSCLQRLKNSHLHHIEVIQSMQSTVVDSPVKTVYKPSQ